MGVACAPVAIVTGGVGEHAAKGGSNDPLEFVVVEILGVEGHAKPCPTVQIGTIANPNFGLQATAGACGIGDVVDEDTAVNGIAGHARCARHGGGELQVGPAGNHMAVILLSGRSHHANGAVVGVEPIPLLGAVIHNVFVPVGGAGDEANHSIGVYPCACVIHFDGSPAVERSRKPHRFAHGHNAFQIVINEGDIGREGGGGEGEGDIGRHGQAVAVADFGRKHSAHTGIAIIQGHAGGDGVRGGGSGTVSGGNGSARGAGQVKPVGRNRDGFVEGHANGAGYGHVRRAIGGASAGHAGGQWPS